MVRVNAQRGRVGAGSSASRPRLDRLFEWFIPSTIARGSDAWQRTRMFLVSHLFGTPFGYVVLAAMYGVDPHPDAAYWLLVGMITGFFAFPFLLRATGRLNLLSVFSVLHLAIVVLYAAYLYGGASSPFLPWMVAVPLNSMFYVGTQPRLRLAVLSGLAALLLGFYLVYVLGHGFPERVPLADLAGAGIISLFCAAAFVSMMAMFYASVVSQQQSALEREAAMRETTEQRLRESEAGYRMIAENVTDIISRTRLADGKRTYVSPAVRHVLGYAPDEVVGSIIDELTHPDDLRTVHRAARQLLSGIERPTLTYRARHKQGHYVWLEATLTLAAGAPGETISVARDISARRAIEEELVRAKLRAEQASRAKSEFLANMSHELRTPLNAIMGFSQLIRDELLGPIGHPKYLEYGHDIHQSGQHLLGLINEILDLAKLEAGRVELQESSIDVPVLVEACAHMLQTAARQAELTLAAEIAPALPPLRGDEKRLKQVLLNLLSNAVKFSEAGGRVTLSAGHDADGFLFQVRDTGIGIPAALQATVLEPFTQVQSALSRNTEGTGLGLPISIRLVELHGGRLTLDSAPGRGTTVSIRLPRSRVVARAA